MSSSSLVIKRAAADRADPRSYPLWRALASRSRGRGWRDDGDPFLDDPLPCQELLSRPRRQLASQPQTSRLRARDERQIEQLRVHGNTAIVMGQETVVETGPVIRRRYTEVWIRAGERWQAVARHANEIRVG